MAVIVRLLLPLLLLVIALEADIPRYVATDHGDTQFVVEQIDRNGDAWLMPVRPVMFRVTQASVKVSVHEILRCRFRNDRSGMNCGNGREIEFASVGFVR